MTYRTWKLSEGSLAPNQVQASSSFLPSSSPLASFSSSSTTASLEPPTVTEHTATCGTTILETKVAIDRALLPLLLGEYCQVLLSVRSLSDEYFRSV